MKRYVTVVVSALSLALVLTPMSGAGAAVNSCQARNLTKGTPSSSNLQAVIDAASDGDTIQIKRVCVGNFVVIGKDLTLVGEPTRSVRKATLDGNDSGTVLLVCCGGARVTLTDLRITGANGDSGGIYNNQGDLTLDGSTTVAGNRGGIGGGINNQGTLTLNNTASVRGNRAFFEDGGWGGGIFNSGVVTLNDSALVRGNAAGDDGGGIDNEPFGTVTLNDNASVTGNTAGDEGGGIASFGGIVFDNVPPFSTVTLNDNASVTGNTAGGEGGGIRNWGGIVTLNGSSLVSANTARNFGGGIWNRSGMVLFNGGTVTGNIPDDCVGC